MHPTPSFRARTLDSRGIRNSIALIASTSYPLRSSYTERQREREKEREGERESERERERERERDFRDPFLLK